MAPGTRRTLDKLRDPVRRPQNLVSRCHKQSRLPENLRTSRRGAAAGPSGMNSDHLFPLLDSERDSMKFYEFASLLARGEVPGEVMEILRMGRITALSKPDGGVRGITVGDILRRLVARTVAQQYSKRGIINARGMRVHCARHPDTHWHR